MLHLHSEAEQIYQPEENIFLNQEINQSRQLKMAKILKKSKFQVSDLLF
jgi:hypothetical protein